MEITRQADYYGLPDNSPPSTPPSEHLADVLRPAPLWSGPTKVAGDHSAPHGMDGNSWGNVTGEFQPADEFAPGVPERGFMKRRTYAPEPEHGRHRQAADPAATAQIQQGIANSMPEAPEPPEVPDYTNGKPL